MKKFIALTLAFFCIFGLVGCNSSTDISVDETESFVNEKEAFFIAKVVDLQETSMLVEVTAKGNSGVGVGNQVIVSTEKIAGVIANDSTTVTDNYLRIEFDGYVMETYPLGLGKIYRIDITNEKGESIE